MPHLNDKYDDGMSSSSNDPPHPNFPSSVSLNEYKTHEKMIFDDAHSLDSPGLTETVTLNNKQSTRSFARTAHSTGEMFGLKFWENWYVIGQNRNDEPEFKVIFYNGKTRQNTYDGAFVYSRTRELSEKNMKHVYEIAKSAGLNPSKFCKIQNGGLSLNPNNPPTTTTTTNNNNKKNNNNINNEDSYKKLVAQIKRNDLAISTPLSKFLGVDTVEAATTQQQQPRPKKHWWHSVGDYFENPKRHFELIDSLRTNMEWGSESEFFTDNYL